MEDNYPAAVPAADSIRTDEYGRPVMEGNECNVWHSPRHGDVRWQGHLLIDQPKLNGKWPTCYTLKMYEPFLSPVQVQQVPTATAGKKCEWQVLLHGEPVGRYDYKTDAQHAALEVLGLR
jgi:hypothetical protein